MLTKRGDLLNLARQSVDESGFVYRKGKSRSKSFGSEAGEGAPAPKRPKISQQLRDKRKQNINEDLKCINTQIQFKERRIETEVLNKNFKLCDLLAEEVTELKKRRQMLNSELDLLIRKENKSMWYYKRKRNPPKACSSDDSDMPFSGSESHGESLRSSSLPSPSPLRRSTISPSPPFSPPLFQPVSSAVACCSTETRGSRVGSPTDTIILSATESTDPVSTVAACCSTETRGSRVGSPADTIILTATESSEPESDTTSHF